MDKNNREKKISETEKESKRTIIGKKVSLYIPEQEKFIETIVKEVKVLYNGKKIVELESGDIASMDILDFIKEEGGQ